MTYDSAPDTLAHIQHVRENLLKFRLCLEGRGVVHDASKLEEPEKTTFDRATPRLRGASSCPPCYRRR